MPAEKPDTIRISEARRHEIPADRADLHVTVEGASLFTGGEALKKAREVAQLVRELTDFGLPATDIFLQGVFADTATGLLGKASLARYKLRLHCADLARLADLLGIVMGQKNARLNVIEWGYPDDDGLKDQWLGGCIARANARAALAAQGLGVRLLGVHTFSEKCGDGEKPSRTTVADEGMFMARHARVSGEELGLEISHTKTVHVSVEVEYLVSRFDPAP
jgi:uncharacterized protein YggE